MAEITFGEAYGEAGRGGASGPSVVHLAGGLVSLALIVGIGIWGGKIIMRDVTGLPVVQAMGDGPMRIAPDNPGGDVAPHAGLTVNAVAAQGEAAAPEDRLVLAPQAALLAQEDLDVAPAELEGVATPPALEDTVTLSSDNQQPLTADDVLALADRIAAEALDEADPLALTEAVGEDAVSDNSASALAAVGVEEAVAAAIAETPPAPAFEVAVISNSVPGVSRSLRPWARPGSEGLVQAVAPGPASPQIAVIEDVQVGTKLVQLGAYDTADLARADWARIAARFDDYIGAKTPIIQQAESGGRSFFRLRAQGFEDLSDARRFCAVLTAENAACIPVVVR